MLRRSLPHLQWLRSRAWGDQGYINAEMGDSRAVVRSLYRDCLRSSTEIRIRYFTAASSRVIRQRIRKEFEKYQDIKDPRVVRARIVYTRQVLSGMINSWTSQHNVFRFFEVTNEKHTEGDLERIRNPQDFEDEFFRDLVQDITYSHKNMRVPLVQKMTMPRGSFYIESELAQLLPGTADAAAAETAKNVAADEAYLDSSVDELYRDVAVAQFLSLADDARLYGAVRDIQAGNPDDQSLKGRGNSDRVHEEFTKFLSAIGEGLEPLAAGGAELRAVFGRLIGTGPFAVIYASPLYEAALKTSPHLKRFDVARRVQEQPSGNEKWNERVPFLKELIAAGRVEANKNVHRDLGAAVQSDKVGHNPALNKVYKEYSVYLADYSHFHQLHVLWAIAKQFQTFAELNSASFTDDELAKFVGRVQLVNYIDNDINTQLGFYEAFLANWGPRQPARRAVQ